MFGTRHSLPRGVGTKQFGGRNRPGEGHALGPPEPSFPPRGYPLSWLGFVPLAEAPRRQGAGVSLGTVPQRALWSLPRQLGMLLFPLAPLYFSPGLPLLLMTLHLSGRGRGMHPCDRTCSGSPVIKARPVPKGWGAPRQDPPPGPHVHSWT